jgi:hypothetical protein
MKKPCIPDLIFQKTFRQQKQGDPQNFYQHISRNIVAEVRLEVQCYFGALDSLEAQYPGLDYAYPPHRRRLSRHPWHRRLFRAFDELGMTNDEIRTLCQWEGTIAAKDKYETDSNTEVRTTTADDVAVVSAGNGPRAVFSDSRPSSGSSRSSSNETLVASPEKEGKQKEVENGDDYFISLLRTAIQSRNGSESTTATGQAWEQWLKDTLEQGNLDISLAMDVIRNMQPEALEALSSITADYGQSIISRSTTPLSQADSLDEVQTMDRLRPDLADSRATISTLAPSRSLRASERTVR